MTERKVWGLLLIVDGLFVALFAGALAGKVYVHIVAEPAVIRGSPGPAVVPRKPPSETSPRTAVPPSPRRWPGTSGTIPFMDRDSRAG